MINGGRGNPEKYVYLPGWQSRKLLSSKGEKFDLLYECAISTHGLTTPETVFEAEARRIKQISCKNSWNFSGRDESALCIGRKTNCYCKDVNFNEFIGIPGKVVLNRGVSVCWWGG